MHNVLTDYYRCPEELVRIFVSDNLCPAPGFFRFGERAVCYGRCALGVHETFAGDLHDASVSTQIGTGSVTLTFDLDEVVTNLRTERYCHSKPEKSRWDRTVRNTYYSLRPLLPTAFRKHLQRFRLRGWQRIPFPAWPVDTTVDHILADVLASCIKSRGCEPIPFIWFWPDGNRACAIMTHDVEGAAGKAFCQEMMDLDDHYGIKSSFQVVPERRYGVTEAFLKSIQTRGFEVNIHDLNHDGHLFDDYETFARRAEAINRYAEGFAAEGFRSACTYRVPDWFDSFSFSYEMSVPNVAHLEPQRGGCCTVMPYFIAKLVELPLTMVEDYTLFHVLGQYSTDLWEEQLGIVIANNGLAAFVVHPDYVLEQRARDVYRSLLSRLSTLARECSVWLPLPGAVSRWWRKRSKMRLVKSGGQWRIIGEGAEQASVAVATLEEDQLTYRLVANLTPTMA